VLPPPIAHHRRRDLFGIADWLRFGLHELMAPFAGTALGVTSQIGTDATSAVLGWLSNMICCLTRVSDSRCLRPHSRKVRIMWGVFSMNAAKRDESEEHDPRYPDPLHAPSPGQR
jgi:hypothetical protein